MVNMLPDKCSDHTNGKNNVYNTIRGNVLSQNNHGPFGKRTYIQI